MGNVIEVRARTNNKELIKLLRRVDTAKPGNADLRALREHMQDTPGAWRVVGDMSRLTQERLIADAGQNSALLRESMTHGCRTIKTNLGYEDAPMLEKLLIECVVLAWLRWGLTELRYTNFVNQSSYRIPEADYWERKLNAAQRRYLRALTTLARVRKMKLPPLQVNFGEKQVNIVGR